MPSVMQQYIDQRNKELSGETLTRRERIALLWFSLVAKLLPGHLEQELLRCGLGGEEAQELSDEPLEQPTQAVPLAKEGISLRDMQLRRQELLVAAADNGVSEVYSLVRQAIDEGRRTWSYDLGGKVVEVFEILLETGMVAPRHIPGLTFTVARKGRDPQKVGDLGGIYIAVEDLKKMALEYDAQTGELWLRDIDCPSSTGS